MNLVKRAVILPRERNGDYEIPSAGMGAINFGA
jgi:hypothetical protein